MPLFISKILFNVEPMNVYDFSLLSAVCVKLQRGDLVEIDIVSNNRNRINSYCISG